MAKKFAEAVIRWRWLIIIATLFVVAVASYGAKHIEFSSNYRVFFSKDNEQLVAFETLQNTYSKADNVLFVLAPKNGDVFTPETLQAVKELTEEAWQLPYSTRVDSLTNYQHTQAEEDDLLVYDLVEDPQTANMDQVRDIALNEPLLLHRLVSPDAKVTAVNATIQLPQKTEHEVPEVVSFSRNIIKNFEARHPDIEMHVTGAVMLNNAFSESSQKDMRTLIPIMFTVIVVCIWLMLRSITGTLTTLLVIVMSIVSAMGIFGWIGWTLTGPTTAAPTIIMTMAVADCVHLLALFLFNMRSGMEKADAMIESIRVNLQPVFITSLTTVIGFMTMNFSEVPPFRDLGNTVSIGVVAAFLFSILFLPAMVMVLPVKVKNQKTQTHHTIDRIAHFVLHNSHAVLWATAIISIGLIALIPGNKINDEFVNYFKKSVEFRQDTDFVADHLSGIYTMQYSLEAGSAGGISAPAFLKDVEKFSDWLRSHPEVIHVETLSDTFKRLNRNMHADDDSYYSLPQSKELAAQYLLLYEMSLPYGLDLNNQLNVDKSSMRVTVTLENISSERTLILEQEISDWLHNNTGIKTFYAASPNIMFSHIGKRNVDSMVGGVIFALVLISLILVMVLRSFKLGLISLLPNLLPIAAAFGVWALYSGNIGMSIGSAAGMTLGIVVDDTVHFLSKYQRGRREHGYDVEQAIEYAFGLVGNALWVTTFVLVAGFTVLAFSAFNMTAHMGIFTASTIAFALVFDFYTLPALLLKLDASKQKSQITESAKQLKNNNAPDSLPEASS